MIDGREEPPKDQITERIRVLGREDSDSLRELYAQEMEWARHFDRHTWVIFGILAPVSLAGLSLFDRVSAVAFTIVGVGSITLLVFWHYYACAARNLWKRRFAITDRIELVWGVRDVESLGRSMVAKETPSPSVRKLRLYLIVAGVSLWLVAIAVKWAARLIDLLTSAFSGQTVM